MESARNIVRNKLHLNPLAAFLAFPVALGGVACSSAAAAATLPVTNCNDAGNGSLRATLALAHSGDSINLSALACGTISLSTGELVVAAGHRGPYLLTLVRC